MGEGIAPMMRTIVPMPIRIAPTRWDMALNGSLIFATGISLLTFVTWSLTNLTGQ